MYRWMSRLRWIVAGVLVMHTVACATLRTDDAAKVAEPSPPKVSTDPTPAAPEAPATTSVHVPVTILNVVAPPSNAVDKCDCRSSAPREPAWIDAIKVTQQVLQAFAAVELPEIKGAISRLADEFTIVLDKSLVPIVKQFEPMMAVLREKPTAAEIRKEIDASVEAVAAAVHEKPGLDKIQAAIDSRVTAIVEQASRDVVQAVVQQLPGWWNWFWVVAASFVGSIVGSMAWSFVARVLQRRKLPIINDQILSVLERAKSQQDAPTWLKSLVDELRRPV